MNGILVVCLFFVLVGSWRYLSNCFEGPAPMTLDEIAGIKDPSALNRYFVSIHGVTAVDTGLQSVEKRVNKYTREVQSETRSATYYAVRAGGKMLLVKSPLNAAATDYEGALVPAEKDVRGWFDDQLRPKGSTYDDVFLPYVLDASPFRTAGYIELAICVPLLLLGVYNIWKGMGRRGNFQKSPIAKELGRFGPADQVAMSIDGELAQYGNRSPLKGTTMSASWLIRETYFGLKMIPLNQILWAYQKVTKRRTNGIPTGTTYGAMVADVNGKRIECTGKQPDVIKLLEQIIGSVPWIMSGYSNELNAMFLKNRPEMAARVEQRRQEFYRQRAFQQGQAGAGR